MKDVPFNPRAYEKAADSPEAPAQRVERSGIPVAGGGWVPHPQVLNSSPVAELFACLKGGRSSGGERRRRRG